jgi:hypothetical protein
MEMNNRNKSILTALILIGTMVTGKHAFAQVLNYQYPLVANAPMTYTANLPVISPTSAGYTMNPVNVPVVANSGATGPTQIVTYTAPITSGSGSNSPQIINSGNGGAQIAYVPTYTTDIYPYAGNSGPQIMSSGNGTTGSGNNGSYNSASVLNVATLAANGIGSTSATLEGSYAFANNGNVMVWFQYGTSTNSLNTVTNSQQLYGESSNFNQKVIGLASNTTYYFRAVAQNGQTVDYGDIRSFTTKKISVASNGGGTTVVYAATNNGSTVSNNTATVEEVEPIETTDRSNLGALAFFGYDFFPNTMLGWILLIIIILVIVLLARRYRNKDDHGHGAHH